MSTRWPEFATEFKIDVHIHDDSCAIAQGNR
jgi:hypothetical protein